MVPLALMLLAVVCSVVIKINNTGSKFYILYNKYLGRSHRPL